VFLTSAAWVVIPSLLLRRSVLPLSLNRPRFPLSVWASAQSRLGVDASDRILDVAARQVRVLVGEHGRPRLLGNTRSSTRDRIIFDNGCP
jgi:hypothetical protein